MYGWIHTGGSTNKFFTNTRLSDVVFRSSLSTNNIIIGNSNDVLGDAGIYVSSNCVGLRKLPSTSYVLDARGNVQIDRGRINVKGEHVRTTITPSNFEIIQGSTPIIQMDSHGYHRNNLMVTNAVKKRKFLLQNVRVLAASIQEFADFNNVQVHGLVIEVDANLERFISEADLFNINGTTYLVIDVDSQSPPNLTLRLAYYFEEQFTTVLPFKKGDVITVEVLEDYVKTEIPENVNIPMKAFYWEVRHDIELEVEVKLTDDRNLEFLRTNNMYILKNTTNPNSFNVPPDNILILIAIQSLSPTVVRLTFRAVDNKTDVRPMADSIFATMDENPSYVGMPFYAFVLDFVQPKEEEDQDAVWGLFVSPVGNRYIVLRNTDVGQYINNEQYKINSIEYINFQGIDRYTVEDIYKDPNNGILVSMRDFDTNLPSTESGRIAYKYIGNPVSIVDAQFVDDYTVRYYIQNMMNFFATLKEYEGKFVYIVDKESKIWKINNVLITLNDAYIELGNVAGEPFSVGDDFLREPRIVYMIPFKYFSLSVLGNFKDSCYIHNKLGIGTNLLNERLVVAGNASINNTMFWYDDQSKYKFYMCYSNDVMLMNDTMQIGLSGVVINYDTEVQGVITANDFLSVSDSILKKNITPSLPEKDLERILRLDIKDYEFKDKAKFGANPKKGVIAQEVEKVVPEIVSHTKGFVPSIYRYGKIVSPNKIIIKEFPIEARPEGLLASGRIRIHHNGKDIELPVKRTLYKNEKLKLYIKDEAAFKTEMLKQRVLVYGHYDSYKIIDKDYLFMMAVNSIKALYNRINNGNKS